ncbi:MAG: FHA domain-containing protein [Leptolyngbyaceae cyanobacterium]
MKLSNILIVEDSQGRREIVLDSSVYSLGRDAKCDIRLASQFVSRHHATLVQLPRDDETYYYRIVDGNLKGKPSANGLLINGRKLMTYDLKNEDKIVFGPQARAIYYQLKRDTLSPDEFGPDPSGSGEARTPNPFTPNLGAEAIPDNGQSNIP